MALCWLVLHNKFGRTDFDGNFNPTIAPIHPDYKERSSLLHLTQSRLVSLYLVSAVDIAVSKLGRFESVDREDIVNLFQNNMFTIEDFRRCLVVGRVKRFLLVALQECRFLYPQCERVFFSKLPKYVLD